ncbi:MAG: hypothetical protein OEX05_04920 [Chloroflexota bacterium]|nr:hypothetical protein [Chloroflexota bacterium]
MRTLTRLCWMFMIIGGSTIAVASCSSAAGSSTPGAPGAAPSSPAAPASPAPTPTATAAVPSPTDDVAVADGEEWIVFQWLDPAGVDGIFLVRRDGTGQHQLVTDLPGEETHPDWSPDGRQIAFIRADPSGSNELWVVDADGTNSQVLMGCQAPCNTLNYPDWAPDGSAIYFGIDSDAQPDRPPSTFGVGRYDMASGESTIVLTRTDGLTAEQPRISPDGMAVAYTRGDILDDGAPRAVYIADLLGGPEERITDPALYAAYPDWAGEDRIIFNSYDLGLFPDGTDPANLYSVTTDGSDLRRLTDFGAEDTRATQPRMTPNGASIIFTQVDGTGWGVRQMAVIELDGTNRRWVTPEPIDGTHPHLRPVSGP